jgi:hypothetical protein
MGSDAQGGNILFFDLSFSCPSCSENPSSTLSRYSKHLLAKKEAKLILMAPEMLSETTKKCKKKNPGKGYCEIFFFAGQLTCYLCKLSNYSMRKNRQKRFIPAIKRSINSIY